VESNENYFQDCINGEKRSILGHKFIIQLHNEDISTLISSRNLSANSDCLFSAQLWFSQMHLPTIKTLC